MERISVAFLRISSHRSTHSCNQSQILFNNDQLKLFRTNLVLAAALGGYKAFVVDDFDKAQRSIVVTFDHHKILNVVLHGTTIQLQNGLDRIRALKL